MTTTTGTESTEGTDTGTEGSTSGTDTSTAETGTDTAAELTKWKDLARKHEDRAKTNAAAAKELDELKKSSMTEQQKAVETAKAEARADTLREVGGKLAEASIRVAAAGRSVDVDALIEGIDAAKFLDDAGDPDTKAITAWVDKVAPVSDDKPNPRRDLGLGARGAQQESGDPAQAFAKFIETGLKQ